MANPPILPKLIILGLILTAIYSSTTLAQRSTPTIITTIKTIASPKPSPSPGAALYQAPPKPNPQSPQTNNSFLVYPGSTIISQSNSHLSLTTSADPQTVTDWYQDTIRSQNYSVNSFVKTTVNSQVQNKLSGSDGNQKISITITNPSQTRIEITLTN